MSKLTITWGDISITIEKPDEEAPRLNVIPEKTLQRATPKPYPVCDPELEDEQPKDDPTPETLTRHCEICGKEFTANRKDSKVCLNVECRRAKQKKYQVNHKTENTRTTKGDLKSGKLKLPPGERVKPYKHHFKPESKPVIKDSTPAIF